MWIQTIGLLVKCYDCKSGVSGNPNPISSKQTVYFATFVQGIEATKRLIIEGHYAKAAALLKQDIEILARIKEITAGSDAEGVNPNVRHLSEELRMMYGALNKLAHPANTNLLVEHLDSFALSSEANIGLSPMPIFIAETAEGTCDLHIYLCFQVTREFLIMLARVYDTSDVALRRLVEDANLLADRIPVVLKAVE